MIQEHKPRHHTTPFPNGWTVFEAPGIEKSLKFSKLALAVSGEDH
jgi:hypothetical protein